MEKLIKLFILFLLISCVKIVSVNDSEKYTYNLKYTILYTTPEIVDFDFKCKFSYLQYDYRYYNPQEESELVVFFEENDIKHIVYKKNFPVKLADISLTRLE